MKQVKYGLIAMLIRFTSMIWAVAKGQMFVYCVLVFLTGAGWATDAIFFRMFFDGVESSIHTGTVEWIVWLALGIIATLSVAWRLIVSAFHLMGRNMLERMNGVFLSHLHIKAGRVDPVEYERPDTLDMFNKAVSGASEARTYVMVQILVFIMYVPFCIIMSVYMSTVDPVLILSFPIIAIPSVVTLIVRARAYNKLEDAAAPLRRKYEYYEKAMSDRDYFKETRTLGAFSFFQSLYRGILTVFNRANRKAEGKSQRASLGTNFLNMLGYLGILSLLVWSLLNDRISVGAFVAFFGSIGWIIHSFRHPITEHYSDIARILGPVRNYLTFLDMPERSGSVVPPAGPRAVEIREARFSYPGSESEALRGVDLTIEPGETLAIVGANGAGKTTLVRLLTGLYLPTAGSVKHGGVDTAEIDPAALYSMTSAVFQKYQRYRMTLGENVRISDSCSGNNESEITAALEKSDISPTHESFPDGLDTMLSREFGGTDISGGQWQRVAIARGLFRPHEILVLDEPTAAIDPLEEQRIYNQFVELSRGKTAIIVTHRLGSARLADRIAVMDGGLVAATGTHEELMATCVLYADMFHAQAQWYA